ncbi:MAG: hypothetical protein IT245_07175, partial [Bacteroidia bacterium]|nr:hypothetical protein [Bacteroidia bacterium]
KELNFKNIVPFDWQLEQESNKVNKDFITRKPMIRTLPFKIGIWSSYYQENRNKSELVDVQTHKDFEKISNESNAKTQSGKAIQISLDYTINRRFSINANIEHGSASGTSTINYIYTDIPVYDSTGKISGYINRPVSQSPNINQTIISKSSSTNLPIQINFTIFQIKRWTLIAGLGSNIQISKHTNFSIFDFKKGQLEEVEERFKYQLSSMANLQFRYSINNKISLGLNYRINPQNLQFHPQGKEFRGILMRNTLQFGLIYTPIIKR